MLLPLTNEPRDYAWGSTTLIAALQGRAPADRPEAEVWFGDHPGDPSITPDGRPLDTWLAQEGAAAGVEGSLPYLLKLLAAASPLSIQAHPTRAQAEAGFAREEAAGVGLDAPHRIYRDRNHKPELIVALSNEFHALAGLREPADGARLAGAMGASGLAGRLSAPDASIADVIAWVLSASARDEVRELTRLAAAARSEEFAADFALARALEEQYPGDPGIIVALLMNRITLRRGEGLFVPAGVLHAYLDGLGVEIMAASDNVLRGGLTPKHIDVDELLDVLDARTGRPAALHPRPVAPGVEHYDVPVSDFSLRRVAAEQGAVLPVGGASIVLAAGGEADVTGVRSGGSVRLGPGEAVLVTPDEAEVRVSGDGEVFIAGPGVAEGVGAE